MKKMNKPVSWVYPTRSHFCIGQAVQIKSYCFDILFIFRRIIPLARYKASQETCPEALFERGTVVMAIYPQTTCFYKGVIKEIPNATSDEYEVLFEDPRYRFYLNFADLFRCQFLWYNLFY